MTLEQHAKTLSILHLVYATGIALFASSIGWFLSEGITGMEQAPLFLLLTFGMMGPFLLTSYGVLRDRPWARGAGLASVVLSILSFPFGTALAAYTLWYFFSEKGRKISH